MVSTHQFIEERQEKHKVTLVARNAAGFEHAVEQAAQGNQRADLEPAREPPEFTFDRASRFVHRAKRRQRHQELRRHLVAPPLDGVGVNAARIDGAGYFRIWWSIFLPLSLPAQATHFRCVLLASPNGS